MKARLFIAITFFLSMLTPRQAFSQGYQSLFGDSSTSWNIILEGYCDVIRSRTIMVSGDTIVDGNRYKIISVPSSYYYLSGFIREDTTQGKVWFYSTYDSTEYLVMDLNLAPGDTFYIYGYNNMQRISRADSVYYVNGLKHIRLIEWIEMCGPLDERMTFIEGSGPTVGFSYQVSTQRSEINSYMLCHYKDGIKITGNTLFWDSCQVLLASIEEDPLENTSVFPNPASGWLNVKLPAINSPVNIELFSLTGQRVLHTQLAAPLEAIQVGHLPAGLYLVKLTLEDGINTTQRIVITK